MRRWILLRVWIQFTAVNLLCSYAHHIPSYGPASGENHVCRLAKGFEPNYADSQECSSYWRCDNHVATLHYCQGNDQFHFQYGECMNDDDVSCWVQMEKYFHGYSYDHRSQSAYSTSKTCDIAQGQEPNYYDEGCKSYWYCEAHEGSLNECPVGFQFDWEKLDCLWDDEVYCEKQVEAFYERFLYKMGHSEKGSHSRADDAYDVNARPGHRSDVNTDSKRISTERRHHDRHRCDVERGREPDLSSRTCQTFWWCVGHRATREQCPDGYLFHWGERECLKDVYVDCPQQRRRRESGGARPQRVP